MIKVQILAPDMIQVQILSRDLIEDQKKRKKRSSPTTEGLLSLKSSEDQKKKIFTAIWYYIRPKFGIYTCWQALFRQIIQRWNLDAGTLTLDGGDTSPL